MRRLPTLAAAAAAALVGLPLGVLGLPGSPPAVAAPPDPDEHSVTLTVDDVRPSTPNPAGGTHQLHVVLTLENTTATPLPDVSVSAERGDPINSTAGLDAAIAAPKPGSPELVSPVHRDPQQVGTLLPGQQVDLPYNTTTSTDTSTGPGICLCHDAIYPLFFTAVSTDPDTGATTTVGSAQTYLPVFGTTPDPAPVEVSWLWPLLDRPHRLSSPRDFLDDDLAGEVAAGGRLDRALRVVEDVAPIVPITLVVDPDLLDELEVMASGRYTVRTNPAHTGGKPGTGAEVAQAWLARFTNVLAAHPRVDVDLTAFGDPDVESLATNGLTWTPTIGDQETSTRVAAALGNRVPQHDVAWPVGSTLSQETLTELVRQGTSTVVVDDTTLARNRGNPAANALAQVPTSAGPALAAVTSATLQADVRDVVTSSGRGLGALPKLVSHLALRVLTNLDTSRYVVLTPPRQHLDVNPAAAARAILATSQAFWAEPVSLTGATQSVRTSDRGVLHHDDSVPGLPGLAILAMQSVQDTLGALTGKDGLLDRTSPGAAASNTVIAVDKIPVGLQRSASSAYVGADGDRSTEQADSLARIVDRIRSAVHLVAPAGNASYTLTSNDAPLPVTVANPLDVDTQVQIHVAAEDNRPGFASETLAVKLPAGTTQQIRVPTHIDLTGRINVAVRLTTPNGQPVGDDPLGLSVRNTALGTVGVAITTIAAVVLAIALLFRLVRAVRWRMRRRTSGPPPPVTDPLAP